MKFKTYWTKLLGIKTIDFILFFNMCMYVCLCVGMYRCLQRPEENIRFPGVEVLGRC